MGFTRLVKSLQFVALALSCGLLPVAVGCTRSPPTTVAVGTVLEHEAAGFTVVLPSGWEAQRTAVGLNLLRRTSWGGGYPTLTIRRLGEQVAGDFSLNGSPIQHAAAEAEYRYGRWSNSRGRGYRLDVLLRDTRGALLVEATLWDPAPDMQRDVFEREFWPIIQSIQLR